MFATPKRDDQAGGRSHAVYGDEPPAEQAESDTPAPIDALSHALVGVVRQLGGQ
jgi:hypothetical protein